MGKLALKADPTFKALVGIPVAGSNAVDVELIFRHRTKSEFTKFTETLKNAADVEAFMAMVTGWELDAEFGEASVKELLENYAGAGIAAYQVYRDEIIKVKLGN